MAKNTRILYTEKDLYNLIPDTTDISIQIKNYIKSINDKFPHLLPDIFNSDFPILIFKNKTIYHKVSKKKLLNNEYFKDLQKITSDLYINFILSLITNDIGLSDKIKNNDNISFLVKNHLNVLCFLLKRTDKENINIITLSNNINIFLKIIELCFNKSNHLYIKYSTLYASLRNFSVEKENDNLLSKVEFKKYIPFENVIFMRDELQTIYNNIIDKQTKKAYEIHQNHLMLSLVSYIPPLRAEIFDLSFTHKRMTSGNYILFEGDNVIIHLLDEKKKNTKIDFLLNIQSPELTNLLQFSYKNYNRIPLFTHHRFFPNILDKITIQSAADRLTNMFTIYNKNVGISSLRSSYVTYLIKNNHLTKSQLIELARKMRTSYDVITTNYNKVYQGIEGDLTDPKRLIEKVPFISIIKQPPIKKKDTGLENYGGSSIKKEDIKPPEEQPKPPIDNKYIRRNKVLVQKYNDMNPLDKAALLKKQKDYRHLNKNSLEKNRILKKITDNPQAYKDYKKTTLLQYNIPTELWLKKP
jgi:hypothetical protein